MSESNSRLQRRQFLMGALFATVAAAGTTGYDMLEEAPERNERQMGLEHFLKEKHADIATNILEVVASRYADYEVTRLRPVLAAIESGALYAYANEEHSILEKMFAVGLTDTLATNATAHFIVAIPDRKEIQKSLADITLSLSEKQRSGLADSVFRYLRQEIIGSPGILPASAAALGKGFIESRLDKIDSNLFPER